MDFRAAVLVFFAFGSLLAPPLLAAAKRSDKTTSWQGKSRAIPEALVNNLVKRLLKGCAV